MYEIRNADKIPAHLPKRLTISFPIWGLFDTEPGGAYHDYDQMMREHAERGFNCIRLDDGAGLIHDSEGNLLEPIIWGRIFGEYELCMRQFAATGEPGPCDVHKRLISLFEAAKKHNIYIILSSWYYLHTNWFTKEYALNDRLHAIDPLDRFMAFAKFLHYIICELEERGLDQQIAFAEIFNEADGLRFINGYGDENHLSDDEIAVFRRKHEEALDWLQNKHPQILFAFDSWTYYTDLRQVPGNMQVYNFHNYFLMSAYGTELENDLSLLKKDKISMETIKSVAESKYPPTDDWYHRVWFYNNLDPKNIPYAQQKMKTYLKEHLEEIRQRFYDSLDHVKENLENNLPAVPVICGEGVSYCGSYDVIWEETSEEYWDIMREVMVAYRNLGMWGTVVRTCCGPEDPVWKRYPEKLLELNQIFLAG